MSVPEGERASGTRENARANAGGARRRWEIALALFCVGSLVFLVLRDLTLPHVRDVEVWLGFELHGAWARWTAPLHWALFAIGAWAFARGHRWIWRAAPLYAGTVAVSHLVWNLVSPSGGGLLDGLWQLVLFSLPALLLWRLAPTATGGDPQARADMEPGTHRG